MSFYRPNATTSRPLLGRASTALEGVYDDVQRCGPPCVSALNKPEEARGPKALEAFKAGRQAAVVCHSNTTASYPPGPLDMVADLGQIPTDSPLGADSREPICTPPCKSVVSSRDTNPSNPSLDGHSASQKEERSYSGCMRTQIRLQSGR